MTVLSDQEFEDYGAPAAESQGAPAAKVMSNDEFDNYGAPDKPLSWSDVPGQALRNLPSSAGKFGSDIYQAVRHPIDTASNVLDVGHGLAQKLGVSFDQDNPEDTAKADAVGKFFADRYGSMEGFKKALASDPVGVAGDLSTVLSGGETALARVPGLVGRAGDLAGTVGRAIDPLTNVGRVAKGAATYVAAPVVGTMTGAGGDALRRAAQAGVEGGQAAEDFRAHMRGNAPMQDVVEDARNAVVNMRRQRGSDYRAGMRDVGEINEPIDFANIDRAVWDSQQVKRYKGQNLSPTTDAIRQRMTDIIGNWRDLDPYEFHTPEGIDALKQQLGDIRDATPYGAPERVAANQIFGAVRQSIVDAAPQYARVMQGYERASDLIREMEGTLSLNPNARIDTTLRKLQSVLRNNVNTTYGRRAELAQYLAHAGAPNLMEKLAGQALNAWEPRGLARITMSQVPAMVAGLTGGIGAGGAGALATLPFMSPRLMGEAAHGIGRLTRGARYVPPAAEIARGIGRVNRIHVSPNREQP